MRISDRKTIHSTQVFAMAAVRNAQLLRAVYSRFLRSYSNSAVSKLLEKITGKNMSNVVRFYQLDYLMTLIFSSLVFGLGLGLAFPGSAGGGMTG